MAGSSPVASTNKGSRMKCECCHKEGFIYERKIVDETFLLCEECDWSPEDIEVANAVGTFMMDLIIKDIKNGKHKPN